MWRKTVMSLSVSTFVLVVPVLKINETHVFNPLWPGHAHCMKPGSSSPILDSACFAFG